MKFVKPLSQDDINQLKGLIKASTTFRIRQRAHTVLLSAKRYKVDTFADIFDVGRDTIRQWIKNWEYFVLLVSMIKQNLVGLPKCQVRKQSKPSRLFLIRPNKSKQLYRKYTSSLAKRSVVIG
jgi:Homeodomain-like domain